MNEYVSNKKAVKLLGITNSTLTRMADTGQINIIKTPGGHRRYNISSYIKQHSNFKSSEKRKICYCRVSSRGQKDDLERQISYMQKEKPGYEVITDIGSGLNFKRKGLRQILDLAHSGEIEELVVAYKDRLSRFGFDLIEYILSTYSNATIVVLNDISTSPSEELTKDILQILTVFSARINGLRKYKNKIKNDKDISNTIPKKNTKKNSRSV